MPLMEIKQSGDFMRKMYIAGILTALLSTSVAFADHTVGNESKDKSCAKIATACLKADYKGKKFWQDCMRPVVLGETVKGVTVEADVVKACQTAKVEELKNELSDLEKAMQKSSS